MTARPEDEDSIFAMATTALSRARHAYAQTFGVEVTDKSIDAEVERLLGHALDNGHRVEVPARLLLALWLRENALRGRGAQGRTPEQLRGDALALKYAKRLKDALVGKGWSPADAAAEAAEKTARRRTTTLSAQAIEEALNRRGGKLRPPRKRSRGQTA